MFIGDIKLDKDGNTVVEGGKIAVTKSNKEFIIRSFKYGHDSWKTYPVFGFDMDKYIGQTADEFLIRSVRSDLIKYFSDYNIIVNPELIILNKYEITGKIIFFSESEELTFYFNLEKGEVTVLEDDEVSEQTGQDISKLNIRKSTNKFLSRR